MAESVDCVVIGAGVVGLAVARELATRGRDVIVLEAENAIGTGTSSRNSEVIHAGLYYPPGSLKARLCVEGKRMLYAYCAERGVDAKAIGKLLVATSGNEIPKLKGIVENAAASGVTDLEWLSPAQVTALEPEVRCVAAVLSPTSGIVDSHALMLALQGDLENEGGSIAFGSPVEGGFVDENGVVLIAGPGDQMALRPALTVNAGGLSAIPIAGILAGFPAQHLPKANYAKGNYFALSGKSPFSRLIYPMPSQAGLGIHATVDLGGAVKFGPDVEWVPEPDYTVNASRLPAFEDAIRAYWPGLPTGALQPGYAGVRPKLVGEGIAAADFVIQGPETHGIPGLINLFGIESPGLTASMALAVAVADRDAE
jgi:L-2-hydroxyglutarate oxidase LhgO